MFLLSRIFSSSKLNKPIGRKIIRQTFIKGQKQHRPTTLLTPFVTPQELRLMLKIDYSTCFNECGVREINKIYCWRDPLGRSFENSNKRNVAIPFEVAARVCQRFELEAKLVDPEPQWDTHTFTNKSSTPVISILGDINHGKTTLVDQLMCSNIVSKEFGSITQNITGYNVGYDIHFNQPDPFCMTIFDTPGHQIFELLRGRAISLADIVLIIISVENTDSNQIREILLQADRFNVPVQFALNKIDTFLSNVEITKMELLRICQELHTHTLIKRDFTHDIYDAVPISALKGIGINELLYKIHQKTTKINSPYNPLKHGSSTPGISNFYKKISRRTDLLVGAEISPQAIGIVTDIYKVIGRGTVINVLLRHGEFKLGDYFVIGSAFGQIKALFFNGQRFTDIAQPGMILEVTGIFKDLGEPSIDDLFIILPKERAYRLSLYRQRVETLSKSQIAGPPLNVTWESDSPLINSRHQLGNLYEGRKKDKRPLQRSSNLYGAQDIQNLPFNERAIEMENFEELDEKEKFRFINFERHSINSELESIYIPNISNIEDETTHTDTDETTNTHKNETTNTHTNEEKDNWFSKVERRNMALFDRWDKRQKLREQNIAKTNYLQNSFENLNAPNKSTDYDLSEPYLDDIHTFEINSYDEEQLPLKVDKAHTPVLPIILRTANVSLFDIFLDEIDLIEAKYNIRIPVVHGGIGPISKNDVVHAEIEQKYNPCPIYAFQVPILPEATHYAEQHKVDIKSYNVFANLFNELIDRCKIVLSKEAEKDYIEFLKHKPTQSGL